MEKIIGFRNFANLNNWDINNNLINMKFDQFIQIIKNLTFPIEIKFGGFKENYSDFLSCPNSKLPQKEPYFRSFSINIRMGKAILIGWPHHNNDFVNNKKLLHLRNEMKSKANIVHKYDNWEDNDFFVVLGDFSNKSYWLAENNSSEIESLNTSIRNRMSELNNSKGVDISLNLNDIYLVQYQNETLELQSSEAFNLLNYNFDLNIDNIYS